ncbi:sulfurtransferase complex subunit TusB [Cellvibrio sp. KY-GH-1]|uniref:sulfurtransferase complex subunit TusB n=1 Tax=Cellvibrio sp. KY-GH-1 TaxID=2303332 RepID=UPI0012469114|nr:sulfurtransferase complex subunit TusB [Cellvibrio sp. KY-GH-1]QEY14865.1 sulfurtransferase complex subunit TusB [Cellvibrio sp. KY-GH-1]
MSTLHIINKSSFTHNTLGSCLAVCSNQDSLLLIEDGVFGALQSAPDAKALQSLNAKNIAVYALSADVNARALTQKIEPGIQLITYEEFVQLTVKHKCIQSWY